jgi:nucleotide-binding universal stress UspA family protein
MKTILIATDFTPAARSAEGYALALTKALDCGLVMLTVYSQVPVTISNSLTSVSVLDKDRVYRSRLDNEAAELDIDGVDTFSLIAREGPRVETILSVAYEVKADLIITGMKNSGKASRRIFGSTITGLMHRSPLPILVIPEGFTYHPLEAVAMGDNFIYNRHALTLQALHRIVEFFLPKRFVYKHIARGDVSQGINDFIDEYGIDLFVMEPQYRTALARWFIKSHTKDMLFKAKIPLMILPGRR